MAKTREPRKPFHFVHAEKLEGVMSAKANKSIFIERDPTKYPPNLGDPISGNLKHLPNLKRNRLKIHQ